MSSEYQSLPPAIRQAAMSAAEAIAPEQSVDEVRESLSVTEKGQPANTIGNCRTVFCHDPLLRDAIRLNLLTDRVDIVKDLGWRRNTSALTDTDVKYLLLYFEQNYGLTSEKKMTAALEQEQESNQKRLQDLAMMQRRSDEQESEVRTFIREIRRYATIEELDEAVLNRLISKILIGEVKKMDGQKMQEVRIVYNFVGEIPEIAA